MTTIRVADFSTTPGGRTPAQGPKSGQEFRTRVLAPQVKKALQQGGSVEVNFDGVVGAPTSFLEETFGGLIRDLEVPYDRMEKTLYVTARAKELQAYITLAHRYMQEASDILKRRAAS